MARETDCVLDVAEKASAGAVLPVHHPPRPTPAAWDETEDLALEHHVPHLACLMCRAVVGSLLVAPAQDEKSGRPSAPHPQSDPSES
jgi:hypothetical protein